MRGKVGTCRPEGCLLAGCFYRKHTDPGLLTQNIYDMILSVPGAYREYQAVISFRRI